MYFSPSKFMDPLIFPIDSLKVTVPQIKYMFLVAVTWGRIAGSVERRCYMSKFFPVLYFSNTCN